MRRYSVEQTLQVMLEPPGQASTEIKSEITAVVRQQILTVASDGAAELACQVESWQRKNWVGQTAAPADDTERQAVLAARLRLKVTSLGAVQIISPATLPEGIDLDSYGDYTFLPARPISVGQEWTGNLTATIKGVSVVISTRSRLESVQSVNGARLAQIAQDLREELAEFPLATGSTATGELVASGSFYGASSTLFDLDAGAIQEQICFFQGKLLAKTRIGAIATEVPMTAEATTVTFLLP